jgi:hypothetical protein
MGAVGCLYCFNEVLNFGRVRIVFHDRFLVRSGDVRLLNTLHFFQCRPHCRGARASRHSADLKCYGLFLGVGVWRKNKPARKHNQSHKQCSSLHFAPPRGIISPRAFGILRMTPVRSARSFNPLATIARDPASEVFKRPRKPAKPFEYRALTLKPRSKQFGRFILSICQLGKRDRACGPTTITFEKRRVTFGIQSRIRDRLAPAGTHDFPR